MIDYSYINEQEDLPTLVIAPMDDVDMIDFDPENCENKNILVQLLIIVPDPLGEEFIPVDFFSWLKHNYGKELDYCKYNLNKETLTKV